jgi:exonuclease SbcC
MIKSIRLLNWRSHADTKLEFKQGTNLIVGIMGAGKSSILEAISFSFFGTFPALERRKLKLDDTVRLNESKARVVLEFIWDGKAYRIERGLERSKKGVSSSAELYRDGSMVEHGSTAVTSYVASLMSLDYDLFTRAIYSEQNNIDHFFNLDPRRRKEEVDALLGLDRFETARTNIVAVINRIRLKREALEGRFSREKLAELDAKDKAQSDLLIAGESSLAGLDASVNAKGKELEASLGKQNKLKLEKEAFERLEKDAIRLSTMHDSVKKELDSSEPVDETKIAESKARLASLFESRKKSQSEMKSLDENLSSLSKESGAIESGLKSAAESDARLEKLKAERSSILAGATPAGILVSQKECEKTILGMESEKKSLEHEAAELEAMIPRLKPGLSECPLCSSKLSQDGINHVKEEKAASISSKKKRISEIAAILPMKKKENESLLKRLMDFSLISERISSLETDVKAASSLPSIKADLDSRLAALKESRMIAQKRLDSISEDSEKLRVWLAAMERLLLRRAEMAELSKKLADSKSILAGMMFDPASFEAARADAERLRIESERLQSERKSLDAQLRMSKELLSLIRSESLAMRAIEKEAKEEMQLEEQLSIFKNALLETQTHLRASLTDAINSAMNEVWPIFYPYRNYPALRLAVSEKDYVFEVSDGGSWKALESTASGGERACAALTLRVALAMVLTPKLSWLILDEPTHNLDSAAVGLLSSALELRVPEVVKQTFVITHDEAFMGSEFASSYRLMRDKAGNGETRIEEI